MQPAVSHRLTSHLAAAQLVILSQEIHNILTSESNSIVKENCKSSHTFPQVEKLACFLKQVFLTLHCFDVFSLSTWKSSSKSLVTRGKSGVTVLEWIQKLCAHPAQTDTTHWKCSGKSSEHMSTEEEHLKYLNLCCTQALQCSKGCHHYYIQ